MSTTTIPAKVKWEVETPEPPPAEPDPEGEDGE